MSSDEPRGLFDTVSLSVRIVIYLVVRLGLYLICRFHLFSHYVLQKNLLLFSIVGNSHIINLYAPIFERFFNLTKMRFTSLDCFLKQVCLQSMMFSDVTS